MIEPSFEISDAGFERRNDFFDFIGREARRDELWAVPVVAQYVDDENALGLGSMPACGRDLFSEFRMRSCIEDFGVPKQLQSLALRASGSGASSVVG